MLGDEGKCKRGHECPFLHNGEEADQKRAAEQNEVKRKKELKYWIRTIKSIGLPTGALHVAWRPQTSEDIQKLLHNRLNVLKDLKREVISYKEERTKEIEADLHTFAQLKHPNVSQQLSCFELNLCTQVIKFFGCSRG